MIHVNLSLSSSNNIESEVSRKMDMKCSEADTFTFHYYYCTQEKEEEKLAATVPGRDFLLLLPEQNPLFSLHGKRE